MISWSVYDNRNDTVIGVWNTFEQAQQFLMDNACVEDIWEVFPFEELLLPVK